LHKPTFKNKLHGLQNLVKGGKLGTKHVTGMKTMKMNDEKTKRSLNPNTKYTNFFKNYKRLKTRTWKCVTKMQTNIYCDKTWKSKHKKNKIKVVEQDHTLN